jgi:drug/metabolite transporter (DMT)-like permease
MSIFRRYPSLLGTLLVILSAIGFSIKAIFVKLAYVYSVDAVTLLALRMFFSLPFFILTALWVNRDHSLVNLSMHDIKLLIILGLLGYYLASFLDFLGLAYISAGLERLILFLYPTLVVVLSLLIYRKPLRKREIFSLLVSYIGIALVFQHELESIQQPHLWLGAGLVFGSALSYALFLIGSGESIAKLGSMRFMSYSMIVACLGVFFQYLLMRPFEMIFSVEKPVYLLAFAMAIISTVLPTFLLGAGIRQIGASRASLISSIGPITTIFLAHVFLNESISGTQIIGSCFVLIGVLLVSLKNN